MPRTQREQNQHLCAVYCPLPLPQPPPLPCPGQRKDMWTTSIFPLCSGLWLFFADGKCQQQLCRCDGCSLSSPSAGSLWVNCISLKTTGPVGQPPPQLWQAFLGSMTTSFLCPFRLRSSNWSQPLPAPYYYTNLEVSHISALSIVPFLASLKYPIWVYYHWL